jgi:predicted Rossmann-fold nucleotide-binding protein
MATETRVMIAGSRYATRAALDYARRVVRRAHQLGWTVLVGDNPKGVDMAVVNECRRLKAKVIVVGLTERPRNGGCAHGQYVRFERGVYYTAGGGMFDRYHERDRYLVDQCDRAVFVWNGDSRGTKLGHDYALRRGKQAHLVTFEAVRHG